MTIPVRPKSRIENGQFSSSPEELQFLEHAVRGQVHLAVNVDHITAIHKEGTIVGDAILPLFNEAGTDGNAIGKLAQGREFWASGRAHE